MNEGSAAAAAHIDGLPEPRRSQMRRLDELIRSAIPDADIEMRDYAGPMIGYGSYDYTDGRGKPKGRWFSVGLASRKNDISLYSMGSSRAAT